MLVVQKPALGYVHSMKNQSIMAFGIYYLQILKPLNAGIEQSIPQNAATVNFIRGLIILVQVHGAPANMKGSKMINKYVLITIGVAIYFSFGTLSCRKVKGPGEFKCPSQEAGIVTNKLFLENGSSQSNERNKLFDKAASLKIDINLDKSVIKRNNMIMMNISFLNDTDSDVYLFPLRPYDRMEDLSKYTSRGLPVSMAHIGLTYLEYHECYEYIGVHQNEIYMVANIAGKELPGNIAHIPKNIMW